MCQSKSVGGRRCAAHTRPAYLSALASVKEADETAALHARVDALEAIGFHASTPSGYREVKALRDQALAVHDYRMGAYLDSCLTVGQGMRDAYTQIEAEVAAQQQAYSSARANRTEGRESCRAPATRH